jgi:hypothetical protein
MSFLRRDRGREDMLFVTRNNTPVLGESCRVGVSHSVTLARGGGGVGRPGGLQDDLFPFLGRRNCISPTTRPPGLLFLKRECA